jgi:hypothetical protein
MPQVYKCIADCVVVRVSENDETYTKWLCDGEYVRLVKQKNCGETTINSRCMDYWLPTGQFEKCFEKVED